MNDHQALTQTHLDLPLFSRGKVRDTYQLDGRRLLMVSTDRISAFDYVLPTAIPDRGRVLTQLSAFWFERTRDVMPNHLLATSYDGLTPDVEGRCMVVKRQSGSTSSAWCGATWLAARGPSIAGPARWPGSRYPRACARARSCLSRCSL